MQAVYRIDGRVVSIKALCKAKRWPDKYVRALLTLRGEMTMDAVREAVVSYRSGRDLTKVAQVCRADLPPPLPLSHRLFPSSELSHD